MNFNLSNLFIPSEENNFRAKIIHSSAIIFYITVIATLQIGFNLLSFVKPGVLGYATDISVDRLLELTNQKRVENGLNPLSFDSQLSAAAAGKANDMFTNNYWAHNSPSGITPWSFILSAGYHYVYAGENLAKDFANSDGVVSAWMASPTHRDNIVNPKYAEIGFAVLNGKLNGLETTLVVQMFGTKAPTASTVIPPIAQIQIPTAIPTQIIQPTVSLLAPTAKPTVIKPLGASLTETKESGILIANLKNSASKTKPTINIFSTTKQFSAILIIILIAVLILDGYIAVKDKQARISGDNIAHIGFLIILIAAVLVTSVGMVR